MGIGVEGAVSNSFDHGATSGTLNVTTSGTDRILLLFAGMDNVDGTQPQITSIATSGLTWINRTVFQYIDAFNVSWKISTEVWWAYASAQLTSAATVVSFGAGGVSHIVDGAAVGIVAVSGLTNFSNPFDPNSSLPKTQHDGAGMIQSPPTVTGVSTTDANDVLLGMWYASTSETVPSGPMSGWTQDAQISDNDGAGTAFIRFYLQHMIVSSVQSNASVTFTTTAHNSGMIIDALTSAGAVGAKNDELVAVLMGP